MNFWIDARGLYLRPLKFFSLFHPPLHIGWDAIANLEPRKTLWIQVYHISFRRDVPMLTFGGRAGRAIFDAWHSYGGGQRSEEHTSELQSLMSISYAVFCLKKKNVLLYT